MGEMNIHLFHDALVSFAERRVIHYMMDRYSGYEFVCVDKLTYAGNPNAVRPAMSRSNFVFYRKDICDRVGIYDVFEAGVRETIRWYAGGQKCPFKI